MAGVVVTSGMKDGGGLGILVFGTLGLRLWGGRE